MAAPLNWVLDELGSIVADDLAVGGVIGGVAADQEGGVGDGHVGDGDLDALGSSLFQVGDRSILAQWGNGDAVHALGHVGLDQFGLFGLVVVGVGGQDLDAVLGAGIGVALDHGLHELVILEDDTRDGDVLSAVSGRGGQR